MNQDCESSGLFESSREWFWKTSNSDHLLQLIGIEGHSDKAVWDD